MDEEGQRAVVRYGIDQNAAGVACLLFAGEFYKFSDAERKRVAGIVVDEANGKIPVLVGVSHSGTIPSVELGKHAKDVGADGVVVTPPYHSNFVTEARLSLPRHYTELAYHIDLPIMIQDYAVSGGVRLNATEVDAICSSAPNIRYIKVEGVNQLRRIKAVVETTKGKVAVFGGMAGYYLLQEMRLGICGSIPGVEVVGPIVEAFVAQKSGDTVLARKRLGTIKPYLDFLIRHFDSFVAVEKEVMAWKGVIKSPTVREPAVPLGGSAHAELTKLLFTMGLGGSQPQ